MIRLEVNYLLDWFLLTNIPVQSLLHIQASLYFLLLQSSLLLLMSLYDGCHALCYPQHSSSPEP